MLAVEKFQRQIKIKLKSILDNKSNNVAGQ